MSNPNPRVRVIRGNTPVRMWVSLSDFADPRVTSTGVSAGHSCRSLLHVQTQIGACIPAYDLEDARTQESWKATVLSSVGAEDPGDVGGIVQD